MSWIHGCHASLLHRLLLVAALLLAPPLHAQAEVDLRGISLTLARSGIIADATRAQALYVRHLEALEVPDDGDRHLTIAIRSAFAANALRERWVRLLAETLDPETLLAAADFYGSVPGEALAARLRQTARSLDEAERARFAAGFEGNDDARLLAGAVQGTLREQALVQITRGAAAWTAAMIADAETGTDPLPWLADAEGAASPPVRVDEALAWQDAEALYVQGLIEFGQSEAGLRFHRACALTLERALADTVRAHAGTLITAIARRRASL
ncbi:MAG: hypothetical protein V2I63_08200 [Pseudomonadales bacterium]|jgi:hypothetical protein|nr:hypothetical protein [Pseudomonadales bacterium]